MQKGILRKSGIFAFFIILVVIIYHLATINYDYLKINSINSDAYRFQKSDCLVFAPNNKDGKNYAKKLCQKEEGIFDYALIPYGDYFFVDYGNAGYYVDDKLNALNIEIGEANKKIIIDYLRYSIKENHSPFRYDRDFYNDTYLDTFDLNDIDYELIKDNLEVSISKYSITYNIPLKYLQESLEMNFGYDDVLYQKPKYFDKKGKFLCLTFDDGPSLEISPKIIDLLAKYDSYATFFVLGNRLGDKQIAIIKEGILNGNEYGSHTYSHQDLRKLSKENCLNEIVLPALYLKEDLDYDVKVYRPPYGSRSLSVDEISPYPAILWNVDSLDWDNEDAELTKETVYKYADENDVILFHDTHLNTLEALEEIIPYYIENGYQLVTISELMNILNIEDVAYFSGR